MIKKADIILAAVLIIAGLAMSYMLSFGQEAGSRAEIYSDGKLYGIYALDEDREITVAENGHTNIIAIRRRQYVYEIGRLQWTRLYQTGQYFQNRAEYNLPAQQSSCRNHRRKLGA